MPAQIADALALDIIEERYAPGDRLNENQIAATWGVSRSPLREALRILEKRGLVVITPQRGARVTALSLKELEELFDIRSALLGLAARQAASKFDPASKPKLEALLRQLEVSADDAELYGQASASAAIEIANAGGNTQLTEMLISFAHRIGRYARIGLATQARRNKSIAHWRALFDAIMSRDEKLADEIQRRLAVENRDEALMVLRQRLANKEINK